MKHGVVNSLYNRARCITTDASWLEREETHLKDVFVVNNFPRQFIESSLQVKMRNNNEETQDGDKTIYYVSHMSTVSEKISGESAGNTTCKLSLSLAGHSGRFSQR